MFLRIRWLISRLRDLEKYEQLALAGFFVVGQSYWEHIGYPRNEAKRLSKHYRWARRSAYTNDNQAVMPYSQEYIDEHTASEIISKAWRVDWTVNRRREPSQK